MHTINKIMVAIDFSEFSLPVAQYAVQLAEDAHAQLLFVNVINQKDINMMIKVSEQVSGFSAEKYLEELKEDRKAKFEALFEDLELKDIGFQVSIRAGIPHEELLKVIEEEKADFLVMAVKGRSNLVDTIIGSCAQKMFRRSPIPLLSIRDPKK